MAEIKTRCFFSRPSVRLTQTINNTTKKEYILDPPGFIQHHKCWRPSFEGRCAVALSTIFDIEKWHGLISWHLAWYFRGPFHLPGLKTGKCYAGHPGKDFNRRKSQRDTKISSYRVPEIESTISHFHGNNAIVPRKVDALSVVEMFNHEAHGACSILRTPDPRLTAALVSFSWAFRCQ